MDWLRASLGFLRLLRVPGAKVPSGIIYLCTWSASCLQGFCFVTIDGGTKYISLYMPNHCVSL